MKSRIVKIGNSQGISIPKPLLDQTGLRKEVEIFVEGNRLIIAPVGRPRASWPASFQKMASMGDGALLDGDVRISTTWDEDDWEWK